MCSGFGYQSIDSFDKSRMKRTSLAGNVRPQPLHQEVQENALLDAGIIRLRPVLITVGSNVSCTFPAGLPRRFVVGTHGYGH